MNVQVLDVRWSGVFVTQRWLSIICIIKHVILELTVVVVRAGHVLLHSLVLTNSFLYQYLLLLAKGLACGMFRGASGG